MEIKEKIDEIVNINAIIDVNSSMRVFSVLFVICKEVMINRQKPNKLEDVPRICCEVLFAIAHQRTITSVRLSSLPGAPIHQTVLL